MWKKTKRAFDVMNERNDIYLKKMNGEQTQEDETDPEAENLTLESDDVKKNDELGLEKGDLPALIISAFLTFSPIFLVLALIMYLAWTFLH